jgi:hypothetical protein
MRVMKTFFALVVLTAACGGSPPPPAQPPAEPVAAAPAPPPEPTPAPEPPPPPPSYVGWYADAEFAVFLNEDGTASVEHRKKKAKPVKGTWNQETNTLTIANKESPLVLVGDALAFSFRGAQHTSPRQPSTFEGRTYKWEKDESHFGTLTLNADNTCLEGKNGQPSPCTYKLEGGKLVVTYNDKPKKPVTSVVWFEDGGKVMITPTQKYTAAD